MTLGELLNDLAPRLAASLAQRHVTGVALDSRRVVPGNLFFALSGQHVEGTRFVEQARSRGAVASVVGLGAALAPDLIAVEHPRRTLALVAARFQGHPGRRLRLVGVTGTNGKTTTALLVAAILEAAGRSTGFIGTLGARVAGGWVEPSAGGAFTTPEAPDLERLFAAMVAAGQTDCAMEVSSHALAQERVFGLAFAAAGFTHLTRDHLDFHGDLESYYLAKRRLFLELLEPAGIAVVNGDDPFGARLAMDLRAAGREVWRFGRRAGCELNLSRERLSLAGSAFQLEAGGRALTLDSPLIGAHNVENLALAAGLGLALGVAREAIGGALRAFTAVPGRLERVMGPGRMSADAPLAFVDYAHTDDALTRVLGGLRALGADGTPGRRLWVVFGCGGDRDPGKRPLMGRAAAQGADVVVATSDNPRSEAPGAILAQVVPGLLAGGKTELSPEAAREGGRGFLVEPDRRAAIGLAASLAAAGDVVLVAGKGHETTQTIGDHRLPFDDRVELGAALDRRAAA